MKKGTKIQVTESAKYNGQDMNWTETFTGQKTLTVNETVFHKSEKKIKEFLAKEICASPYEYGKSSLVSTATRKEVTSKYNWKSYLYAIELPAGTIVDTYGSDEYRFDIDENTNIIFVGTIIEAKGESNNYIQYSDTIKL